MKINLNELIKKIQNKELSRSQIHQLVIKEKDTLSVAPLDEEAGKYINRIDFELYWQIDKSIKDEEGNELFINEQLLSHVLHLLLHIFQSSPNIEGKLDYNHALVNTKLYAIYMVKDLWLDKKYIKKLTKILKGAVLSVEINEVVVISKPEKMNNQLSFVQKYNSTNKKSLEKVINFIKDKFYFNSIYEEDISDYHVFKLYQGVRGTYFFKTALAKMVDKYQNIDSASKTGQELYNTYLTDPQLIKSLNRVESCIKDIYFKYKLICKKFNPESPFSLLPDEVIHHIIGYLGNYSLCEESYNEPNIVGDL